MIIAQLLQVIFPMTFAVDPDCNYNQQMDPGVTYYVYNSGYPAYYPVGKHCRWIATAPEKHTIQADCKIEMPQTPGCTQDRLLISLTGDTNLVDAHTYCGTGSTSLMTQYNNISIGLITAPNTPGGRFLCTLQAKRVQNDCDCGYKYIRRIVGGIQTEVNEYPMMAGIVDFDRADLFCGATIIASKYAVSAAHCFKNRIANRIGLLVGAHNLTMASNATRLMRVQQIITHHLYVQDDPTGNNDIAVIRTEDFIEFNQQVGPACLPFRFQTDTFAGQSVEVLGWGTIEFTGAKSDVLLKTDMNVESEQDCYSKVAGNTNQICTFKAGHDSCQSDSGGPLLWSDSNTKHIQLVGVVSHGEGCASRKPSLNTRVTSYLSWIQSVTPDADYCVK